MPSKTTIHKRFYAPEIELVVGGVEDGSLVKQLIHAFETTTLLAFKREEITTYTKSLTERNLDAIHRNYCTVALANGATGLLSVPYIPSHST